MGQGQSLTDSLPDVDSVHMQVVRHTKVLTEINSLTYEEFKTCLDNLNTLSRKCIDPNGKQLVFLVKRGTDTSLLWKATVKIACIKVDPQTRQIQSYKFLNLKQFLCVFKTFQSHLDSLVSSENQRHYGVPNSKWNLFVNIKKIKVYPSENDIHLMVHSGEDEQKSGNKYRTSKLLIRSSQIKLEIVEEDIRRGSQSTPDEEDHPNNLDMTTVPSHFTASMFMSALGSSTDSSSGLSSPTSSYCSHNDHVDECSICLDRSTEVILPCTHSFCTPCIEQWNVNNKTCPICSEALESTDDTWVMSNIPGVEEINEKICAEFMNLAKEK